MTSRTKTSTTTSTTTGPTTGLRGTRRRGKVVVALAAGIVALAVVGCSGDDDSSGADDAAENDAVTSDAGDDGADAPPATVDPAYAGLVDALGGMTLTTPESGGGDRPVLAWEPVEGAALYAVTVLDEAGTPYWGWRTPDTEVRVGVGDRADDVPGPRVAAGMTWSVVALDSAGVPMAVSPRRPIAP